MKITLPITILFIIVSFLIIRQLLKWNEVLSEGQPLKKIHACNWESPEICQEAVEYWRSDADRTTTVKKIVGLDLFYMALYGSFFPLALYTQTRKNKPQWLIKWMRIGIPFFIIFTLIAIFQGVTILYFVTDPDSHAFDRRLITKIKWVLCGVALIPLLLSLIPFRVKPTVA